MGQGFNIHVSKHQMTIGKIIVSMQYILIVLYMPTIASDKTVFRAMWEFAS